MPRQDPASVVTADVVIPMKLTFDPETGDASLQASIGEVPVSLLDTRTYISIADAAKRLGVSYEMVSEWVNRASDPLPHIKSGRKRLVRADAIEDYARQQEEVR